MNTADYLTLTLRSNSEYYMQYVLMWVRFRCSGTSYVVLYTRSRKTRCRQLLTIVTCSRITESYLKNAVVAHVNMFDSGMLPHCYSKSTLCKQTLQQYIAWCILVHLLIEYDNCVFIGSSDSMLLLTPTFAIASMETNCKAMCRMLSINVLTFYPVI